MVLKEVVSVCLLLLVAGVYESTAVSPTVRPPPPVVLPGTVLLCEMCGYSSDEMIIFEGPCPNGNPLLDCKVNPCVFVSCNVVKEATCVVDACGKSCTARWLYRGVDVTDQCIGE